MTYSIKQRVGVFVGVCFFLMLSLGISFIGCHDLLSYYTYPTVVVFSMWTLFAACFVGIYIPLLCMLFPVVIYGRQISIKSGKILLAFSFIILILVIIGMLMISFSYKQSLMDRKYIQCDGIPTGWMPGMATKYVSDKSLCYKED